MSKRLCLHVAICWRCHLSGKYQGVVLIVHHNSTAAPGGRDRPRWRLTEAAVKDEMKPVGIHPFLGPASPSRCL